MSETRVSNHMVVVEPTAAAHMITAASRLIAAAMARTAAAQQHPDPVDDANTLLYSLLPGLASLAVGRFQDERVLLQRAAPAVLPLLAARHVAWTGDLASAAAAWPQVRDATDRLIAIEPDSDLHALVLLATCTELQRTAADLGDPQLAARLHGRARTAQAAVQRRALTGRARSLAAALALRPPEDDAMSQENAMSQESVASLDQAAPQTAAAFADDVVAGGLAILEFVHGVLGIEPDAPRQRLRLRPRLFTLPDGVHVRGVRFGDGSVCLRAHRTVEDGLETVTIHIEQTAGALPVTVLLEPVVAGTVVAARVDTRPAELSPRPGGDMVIVPVQLVLDGRRTLELDTQLLQP